MSHRPYVPTKIRKKLEDYSVASRTGSVLVVAWLAACAGVDPGGEQPGDDMGTSGSGVTGGSAGATGTGGNAGVSPAGGVPNGGSAGVGNGGTIAGGGFGGAGAGATAGAGAGVGGTTGGVAGDGGSAGGPGGAGLGGAGIGGVGVGGAGIGGVGMGGAGQGGTSGSAGKGGSAGAGAGGKGGAGGMAGKGGTGGAGAGGKGGSGGSSGSAGKGGSGGGGSCQVPTAPSQHQQTINLTWQEMTGGFQGQTGARPTSASVMNFRNTILDQLSAAGGSLSFCVRWDSTATASAQLRDQIAAALTRGVNEWFSKLIGHNCWPHNQVPVRVTGWATRNRNLLSWTDDSVPIYVNDIRENAPQCAEACGRFFHQQPGYTYPQCPGGIANHYDMSLWLTDGFQGGAGGDWGQRVGREYFTQNVNAEHLHIWLHEFGHGLGFPDYYNWNVWAPGVDSPNSVMVAGRATLVTDWDTWMIRHLYNNLKSRL